MLSNSHITYTRWSVLNLSRGKRWSYLHFKSWWQCGVWNWKQTKLALGKLRITTHLRLRLRGWNWGMKDERHLGSLSPNFRTYGAPATSSICRGTHACGREAGVGASGQRKNCKGNSGNWLGFHTPHSDHSCSITSPPFRLQPTHRSPFGLHPHHSPKLLLPRSSKTSPIIPHFLHHLTPLQSPSLRYFVSLATTTPTLLVSPLFLWLLFLILCKLPFLSLGFILGLFLLFFCLFVSSFIFFNRSLLEYNCFTILC